MGYEKWDNPLSQSTPAPPNDGFRLIGHQRWGIG